MKSCEGMVAMSDAVVVHTFPGREWLHAGRSIDLFLLHEPYDFRLAIYNRELTMAGVVEGYQDRPPALCGLFDWVCKLGCPGTRSLWHRWQEGRDRVVAALSEIEAGAEGEDWYVHNMIAQTRANMAVLEHLLESPASPISHGVGVGDVTHGVNSFVWEGAA